MIAGGRWPGPSLDTFRKFEHGDGAGDCPRPRYFVMWGFPVRTPRGQHRRFLRARCNSRRCTSEGCQVAWKRYQQARIFSGCEPSGRMVFLTVTAPGADLDVGAFNEVASTCWHRLMVAIRRTSWGRDAEYVKVGEIQRRGAIHYHALFRMASAFVPHHELSALAVRAGFGEVCWVERVWAEKGGSKGAVAYLTKYLLKAISGWPNRVHLRSQSRGWATEWCSKSQWSGERVAMTGELVGSTSGWSYCRREDEIGRALFLGRWPP